MYGDPYPGHGWKLVCVREGSSALQPMPIPIREKDLSLVNYVARGLSLVVRQDDQRKKITLIRSGVSVRYPSGFHAQVISEARAGVEYQAREQAPPCIAAWPSLQLSESFWSSHFQAPGYPLLRVSPLLVEALEAIKQRAGHPLEILSGYRPPAFNRQCGGASDSLHIDGLAADLRCQGLEPWELYKVCDKVIGGQGGVGYYPQSGFVHIDLRGYQSRWYGQ